MHRKIICKFNFLIASVLEIFANTIELVKRFFPVFRFEQNNDTFAVDGYKCDGKTNVDVYNLNTGFYFVRRSFDWG